MLVLSRKVDESIRIGDDVLVTVTRIGREAVRLGITAPRALTVLRTELERARMVIGPTPEEGACPACGGRGNATHEIPDLALEITTTCPECGGRRVAKVEGDKT